MDNNLFFAFEGIDGCGKSTQIKLLRENIERTIGREVIVTREPTGEPIGGLLRDILGGGVKSAEETIALLFAADRYEHIINEKNGLLKLLSEGHVVLSDRFYLSSLAYQCVNLPFEFVFTANSAAMRKLRPAAHIYIDVTPQTALRRIAARGGSAELFESEERLAAVRENFLALPGKLNCREKIIAVDGNGGVYETAEKIWTEIRPLITGG